MNQQTTELKEVTFDERGNTVEDTEAPAEQTEELQAEVQADTETTEISEAAPEAAQKYRIGERWFATEAEALSYAQNHVSALETEAQVADAYRQGLRDANTPTSPSAQNVTAAKPAEPEFNTEEFYTDPQTFLAKFASKIKAEAATEVSQTLGQKEQSNQIWREFTDRHPMLAEFRTEVENYVATDTPAVRAIIATKGQSAAYDYVATKVKSRFENYVNAVKPKRVLTNGTATASPTGKTSNVTSTPAAKKPLNFVEQIKNIRKGKR